MLADKIVCFECQGQGYITLNKDWEKIDCYVCDGIGTILNPLIYSNSCPACGESILPEQKWCKHHQAAENV